MYKLTHTDTIIRIADGASIPTDENNSDYREYLKWRDGWVEDVITLGLQDGEYVWEPTGEVIEHPPHTPEPADPVIMLPVTEITMAQARLALLHYNLLDTVNTTVHELGGAAQIEWEYRDTVHKDSALVRSVKQLLGWSDAQMDDMFTLAATL